MTEVPLEPSCHDEAIAVLERRIDTLHASAHSIVDRHWTFVYSMEKKFTGWEHKSTLQVRCMQEGNSIRLDWCGIKWYGSKANGDRKSIRTHVTRPKGAYEYTLSKLKALAQDWEADMVEETESQLTKIRREASHLVKAIIYITLLHVFIKESSHRSSKDFKVHCIIDEVGQISAHYLRELLKFAKNRNIMMINGLPNKSGLESHYKYTYQFRREETGNVRIFPSIVTEVEA
jgi:hypothetical protein